MAQRSTFQKFPQVDHHEAAGVLGEVYEDIHNTLRVPWVAFAIRVMSQFPAFIPAAWTALKPQISTRYAEHGADLVRQASIIPGAPPPDPTPRLLKNGWSQAEIARLKATLDTLNYGNPKYLILITAWNEAWHERDAGGRSGKLLQGKAAEILPYGLPAGVAKLSSDRSRRRLGAGAASIARDPRRVAASRAGERLSGLGRVAGLPGDRAGVLKPVALTAEYEETTRRIRKIAREHIRGFDKLGGVSWRDLTDKLSPEQIAGLTGLLFLYNRFIADITVAVIRLRTDRREIDPL